jgi:hypothetical protein
MRKTLVSVALICMSAASGSVLAKNDLGYPSPDNNGPGCGVGQTLWKGQTGLLPHISASTTNGTFLQSFAVSSETSGCQGKSVVKNDHERKIFVADNLDNLAQEIAQGQGNYLASLAVIMGISETDKPAFFSLAQNNYAQLFESNHADYGSMLAALDSAMSGHPQLMKYVK